MAGIDPEVRANIRGNLLDSITELSDLLCQEATWGLINNPHFTFVEFSECFFDSLPKGVDDALGSGLISANERDAIRPLWTAISDYKAPKNDVYDDISILADPKWHKVVEIAAKCREELLSLVGSDEVRHLSINSNRDWSPNTKGDK